MSLKTPKPNVAFILISILVATFPLAFNIILKYMELTDLDKSTELCGIIIYYIILVISFLSNLSYYLVAVLSITAYLVWSFSNMSKNINQSQEKTNNGL